MLQHYERYLGPRRDGAALHRGVRVLTFNSPFGGAEVVLATDGARGLVPAPNRGCEFVMLCRPECAEAVAGVLCDLAHYGAEHERTLSWFHVLPLGTALAPGASLTSLFLTMPWFGAAGFYTGDVDGRRVDVLHVIPTTEREREFFKSSGADALEKALNEAGLDLSDFERASAV